jgi:phenylalanyl-tRNA synthetase beta chain
MRLSLNWLADFVDLSVEAQALADRLTMAGLEVEAVEEVTPGFSGVVVGKVLKVERHPQADRLQVAEVTTGSQTYRVVCGPNVAAGVLYPFAPPGVVLGGGQKLKPAKLRGVLSEGMLLAEDELGLSADHVGLMAIPQDLPLGRDFAEALGLADTVLEVAITANRADCLSVLGLAREVAALLGAPAPSRGQRSRDHGCRDRGPGDHPGPRPLPPLCRPPHDRADRGASPFWMRRRLPTGGLTGHQQPGGCHQLRAAGVRPAPARLRLPAPPGGEIVVRLPKSGERCFTTLDGCERELNPATLLICDAERPVALAGVMGGLDSEVTEATTQVLLESAYFNPRTIRRTAKRLGLSTEASYRFERGVTLTGDPALERATQLMCEVGTGIVAAKRLDEYPAPIQHPRLNLRVSRTNQVLGTEFSRSRCCTCCGVSICPPWQWI